MRLARGIAPDLDLCYAFGDRRDSQDREELLQSFIARRNIERLRALLKTETDSASRETITHLLEEEKAKLRRRSGDGSALEGPAQKARGSGSSLD